MMLRNTFSSARRIGLACFSTTRYTKSHEWVTLDGGIGTIGITDHAQSALGDIVFVELPDVGAEFQVGEDFGALESVKAASDLYAPVAGEVVEVNTALDDEPGLVNTSPQGDGWMIKMKLDGPLEGEHLLEQADYDQFVKEEEEDH